MGKKLFIIGDRVKIKEDLVTSELYNGCGFVFKMKEFKGKEAKVKIVDYMNNSLDYENVRYLLDIDNGSYSWSSDMLEFVETKKENTWNIFNAKEDRVIPLPNGKIIYSYPAIIYIVKEGNKIFKGVAKCLPEDEYNEVTGLKIAKAKAEIKRDYYNINKEIKEFDAKIDERLKALNKREKYLAKLVK
jgi:hypothetical protein